jgi:filamentous hemagglutinin family protein
MKQETRYSRLSTRQHLLAAAVATCFAVEALALPVAPTVINGSAGFATSGNTLTVTNSPGAIINWQRFGIAAGETTRFIQPSASSAVLNQVVGTSSGALEMSRIYGTLSSNGRVWLVNPAGIMIGAGGIVDTAGFVASSLKVKPEDFLAGRLNFEATAGAGDVINQGTIRTPLGGSVYLVGPNVTNEGIITTPNGETILAAGATVSLIDTATPGVKVEITGAANNATNLGNIVAEAGRIGIAGSIVRNSGTLDASSVTSEGGRIFLKASQDTYVDGAGRIVATGTAGGNVEVLGNRVAVMDQAGIDVSGTNGGGTIKVGGDYQGRNPDIQNAQVTFFGPDATLKANATEVGAGGTAIVWADDTTRALGHIEARGGANGGDGGFVETSGKQYLDIHGIRVDTRAPKGQLGQWLLDPDAITVDYDAQNDNCWSGLVFSGCTGTANVAWDIINANLSSGNVTLQTGTGGTGDITFWPGGSYSSTYGGSLTILANGGGTSGNINMEIATLSLAGNLTMYAGWNGSSGVVSGKGNISLGTANLTAAKILMRAGGSVTSGSLQGLSATNGIDIRATGVTINGPSQTSVSVYGGSGQVIMSANNALVISNASISSAFPGDSILLSGASLTINSSSLSPAGNTSGRWLAWAESPSTFTGSLNEGFRQYSCSYLNGTCAGLYNSTGNGLIFASQPAISLSLSGSAPSKTYDGTAVASGSGLTISGTSSEFNGPVDFSGSFAYDTKNVGTGKNIIATVGSSSVQSTYSCGDGGTCYAYGITATGQTASFGGGVITPATLSGVTGITANNKVYDARTDATLNLGNGNFTGMFSGDALTLTGATGAFANKNAGTGKLVNISGITLGGADAGNYVLTSTTSSATANITPATLSGVTGVTANNKVYDARTDATLNLGNGNFTGMFSGDALTVTGATGAFANKNAGTGKLVNISGITLGGADAGNYVLASTTSSATANITPLPLTTWVGTAGGWSDPLNWAGRIVPETGNVLAAAIPAGANVTYDGGSTRLDGLSSLGSFSIPGGTLAIGGNFSSAQFSQSGGSMSAANFTASYAFNQTAGTLAVSGAANITQASGNLAIANLSAGSAHLVATTGAITQTGAIIAASLETRSATGTILQNSGNQIARFQAQNTGTGDIQLANTGTLSLTGATNTGGSIFIDNHGGISVDGRIASAGTVNLIAHSPITVNADTSITGAGNVTLSALSSGPTATTDLLDIYGSVTSTAGNITLLGGSGVTVGSTAILTASLGNIQASSTYGNVFIDPVASVHAPYFSVQGLTLWAPATQGAGVVGEVVSEINNTTDTIVIPLIVPIDTTRLITEPEQTVGGGEGEFGSERGKGAGKKKAALCRG